MNKMDPPFLKLQKYQKPQSSCGPVSVLNTDYKQFTKILTSRLNRAKEETINGDLVELIPER